MAPALAMAAAWTLAGILLLAAAHKLRNFLAFRGIVQQYRLLPDRLVPVAAPLLIAAEAAVAFALLAPATLLPPATAALMATLLLGIYTGAIALNLARGRPNIDCGCGGQFTPLSAWLLARNGLLLSLSWAAGALPAGQPSPATYLLAGATAAFLWCTYASANQLLANRGRAQLAWGAGG